MTRKYIYMYEYFKYLLKTSSERVNFLPSIEGTLMIHLLSCQISQQHLTSWTLLTRHILPKNLRLKPNAMACSLFWASSY